MGSVVRTVGPVREPGRLERSDHLCWVVRSGADYDEAALAYIREGARSGDKVFAFGPEGRLGAEALTAGAAVAADPRSAFLHGGGLDADVMLEMFREESATARAEGYRGLRVIADMDWLLPAAPEDVLAFELRLDEVVADTGATIVCAYRSGSFDPGGLAHVLSVHPATVASGQADLGFRLWSSGAGRWELSGEVDGGNAEAFELALRAAVGARGLLTLEAGGLEFIDLAGLRSIVRVVRDAPRPRVRMLRASATFRRCWQLAGFAGTVPAVELLP